MHAKQDQSAKTVLAHAAGFPRTARLLVPAAFQRVFANGRRLNARPLQLIVCARDDGSASVDPASARLGLTVAKRVARRAVDRNRIKRIARDSFRQQRQHLAGLDLVLLARAGIVDLPNDLLRQALNDLWRRAQPLKPLPMAVTLAPRCGIDADATGANTTAADATGADAAVTSATPLASS